MLVLPSGLVWNAAQPHFSHSPAPVAGVPWLRLLPSRSFLLLSWGCSMQRSRVSRSNQTVQPILFCSAAMFYSLAPEAWVLWFFGKEGLGTRWKTGLSHTDVSPAEPWPLEMPGFPLCTKIPRLRQHILRLDWKIQSCLQEYKPKTYFPTNTLKTNNVFISWDVYGISKIHL